MFHDPSLTRVFVHSLQVKVATIKHITGKRLYLEYDDFDTDDNGELWMDREN